MIIASGGSVPLLVSPCWGVIPMAKKPDYQTLFPTIAVDLAGEVGWDRLTLTQVAEAAKSDLSTLRANFAGKDALLTGFGTHIDRRVLAEHDPEPDPHPRDRLFDVLMTRFDVLNDHRAGVLAVLDDLRQDPLGAAMQAIPFERSMAWMLEAAGIGTRGLRGRLKIRVLGLLYLDVLRTWRKDESPDMAATMKALDERLRQAEQLANTFEVGSGGRRPKKPTSDEAAPEPEPPAPPSTDDDREAKDGPDGS